MAIPPPASWERKHRIYAESLSAASWEREHRICSEAIALVFSERYRIEGRRVIEFTPAP